MANSQQLSSGDVVRLRQALQRGVAFSYDVSISPPLSGDGSPEGIVAAVVGTSYWDFTNHALYMKDTGTGNTGWFKAT